jgi:hypothetical protein
VAWRSFILTPQDNVVAIVAADIFLSLNPDLLLPVTTLLPTAGKMSSTGPDYTAASYGETKVSIVLAVSLAFTIASSIVFTLRVYTRTGILRNAGPDDWTMLVAQIFGVAVSVMTCMQTRYGLGRHAWTVSPQDSARQLQLLYAVILTYNFTMNIIKISFLLQYRRIFQSNMVKRACKWGMAYVVVWTVVQSVLLGISCIPVSFIVPSTASFCLNTLPIWYFSSAMATFSDAVIFSIPVPSVLRLKLPPKQKLMLLGVFGLGFL